MSREIGTKGLEFPTLLNGRDACAATLAGFRDLPASNTFELMKLGGMRSRSGNALRFVEVASQPDRDRVETFDQFLSRISKAANLFRAAGVHRKNAVAILLPLVPENLHALWGAEVAGIALPINYLLATEHIAGMLNATGCKVLVAYGPEEEFGIWKKVEALRSLVPTLDTIFWVGNAPSEDSEARSFVTEADLQSATINFPMPQRSDAAAYFHTGGTTGAPKLAIHTHENQMYAAWACSGIFEYQPTDRIACGMPLFHVAGSLLLCLASTLAGSETILTTAAGLRNRDLIANIWRFVEQYKISVLAGSPTSLAAVSTVSAEDADLSSLRFWFVGGSPLPRELAAKFEQAFQKPVREGFGMTESAGMIAYTPVAAQRRPGSAGFALPGEQIGIFPPDGDVDSAKQLAVGQTGVIAARGPNIFPGYTDPRKNEGTLTAGKWLVTGDLGRMDEDGYVYITGRMKDIIIRGSHNIDPTSIEDAAILHPAVLIAGAVGQPDARAGELPVLYVTLKPGMKVSNDELQAFVSERVQEPPAKPKSVFVIDQMPMTAVGKVFKPDLRIDATRRALRSVAYAVLKREIEIDVTIDSTKGLHARILSESLSSEDEILLAKEFSQFALSYDFVRGGRTSASPETTSSPR